MVLLNKEKIPLALRENMLATGGSNLSVLHGYKNNPVTHSAAGFIFRIRLVEKMGYATIFRKLCRPNSLCSLPAIDQKLRRSKGFCANKWCFYFLMDIFVMPRTFQVYFLIIFISFCKFSHVLYTSGLSQKLLVLLLVICWLL